jgi:hypothetical protein
MPSERNLGSLTSGLSGVDFVMLVPTAAQVSISGRVSTVDGSPVSRAHVSLIASNGVVFGATSNTFGYYSIDSVPAGATYILSAQHGRHSFAARSIFIMDEVTDVNIEALPR